MQLSDLKSAVRTALWDDENSVTDAVLMPYVTEALRQIVSRRRWSWLEQIQTTSAITDTSMLAPADFLSPVSLSVYDPNGWLLALDHKPMTVIRDRFINSDSGMPVAYGLIYDQTAQASRFYFGPAPDIAYNFELIYKSDLTVLSADTDSNYVTNNLFIPLVHLTAGLLAATVKRDAEGAERMMKLYENGITKAEDEDDARLTDLYGGDVRPDLTFYNLASRNYLYGGS